MAPTIATCHLLLVTADLDSDLDHACIECGGDLRQPASDIRSDGRTVWIDGGPYGFTIARFGPMGVDVHTPDTTGCLDCTHGPTGPEHWDRFVASVRDHYGIVVPDEHCPDHCR